MRRSSLKLPCHWTAPLTLMLLGHAGFAEVEAAIVIDNLTPPSGWDAGNIFVSSTWNHAVSFTTGSTGSTVDNVQFMLYIWPDSTGGDRGAGTHVSFYSNSSGSPGSMLPGTSNLTNPTFSDGSTGVTGTYTFTPASTISLAANTTYWIKLSNDTTDLGSHQSINMHRMGPDGSTTSTTSSGFTYNTMKSGSDGGGWGSSNFYPYPAFSLSVTAVPEPTSTAAAFGAGLLVLAGWQRSCRQSTTRQKPLA